MSKTYTRFGPVFDECKFCVAKQASQKHQAKTMDESSLNEDTIGLIFSLLPEMYPDLCTVCKTVKSLLKQHNIDGWDCLIARGLSITIMQNSIEWKMRGEYHSARDIPAITRRDRSRTGYAVFRSWYRNGQPHRMSNPAHVISIERNNTIEHSIIEHSIIEHIIIEHIIIEHIIIEHWYYHGKTHRDDGPAVINHHIESIEWYKYEEYHRDGDLPAGIHKTIDGYSMYYVNNGKERSYMPVIMVRNDGRIYVRRNTLNDSYELLYNPEYPSELDYFAEMEKNKLLEIRKYIKNSQL